ncbi:MAG: homoserine kinase type [Actinomycetota bacterium]|nr:homoserine kinase type [Actinomycetota bacterium]
MNALSEVLDRYTVTAGTGRGMRPLDGGATTKPRLVTTRAGRFVLRRLPEYLEPDRARFAATVQRHAATTMTQVPAVIATRKGDLVTEVAGNWYMLTAHVPGSITPGVPSPSQCQYLGDVLGRLHTTLATATLPSVVPRQVLPADPTSGICQAIAAHEWSGCGHPTVRQVLRAKLRRAQALNPDDLDTLRALPHRVIHGDIHPGNILTSADVVTGIVDFDLARLAPPTYELLRAMVYCLHPAGPVAVYGPRARAFLTGYLNQATVTRREIATMTSLYEATQILDCHGLDVCINPSPDLIKFGHARYALLYWLRHNRADLTHLALDVYDAHDHSHQREVR